MNIPWLDRGVVAPYFVPTVVCCLFGLVVLPTSVKAQGVQLYINEVIAENNAVSPADISGGHPDMIELYNAGDEDIPLGASQLATGQAYALSDKETYEPELAWHFPAVGIDAQPIVIPAKGFIVIFCDANDLEKDCELHASFRIDNNGSEPITLFGPEGPDGIRPIVDQVWLPPLRNNHSFGRSPDGAGPAPVPLEETFEVFHHFLPENTSFGECVEQPELACTSGRVRRFCGGMENSGPGDNLEPRIEREAHTTSAPEAGEVVDFVVRVEDDGEPSPGNIAKVQIRYTVDGVSQLPVEMVYDSDIGILDGSVPPPPEPGGTPGAPKPLKRWSLWHGSFPAFAAGAEVVFEFYVEDRQELGSTSPRKPCADGIGPCDSVGLPGPGCVVQDGCVPNSLRGCKFDGCETRRRFLVGYEPPPRLQGLLVNEVFPTQVDILKDPSQNCQPAPECLSATPPPDCPKVDLTCGFEDFIELTNTSSEIIDLSGLWLSDRPFHPQGWQFPPGSEIDPGEYLIVWIDNDGGKCPREAEDLPGDGQECPDPTQPELKRFHTNFNLEANGDQVVLFEETPQGFGVVDMVVWDDVDPNIAVSRIPDGSRDASFVLVEGGSPALPNNLDDRPLFMRGDSNQDCTLDLADAIHFLTTFFITGDSLLCPDAADTDDTGVLGLTDAIFLLDFLFRGTGRPPAPGPDRFGLDPTDDTLGPCQPGSCP